MSPPRLAALMLLIGLGAAACGSAAGTGADAARPEPAPAVYVSADKNVTFPTPAGAFYCPKPADWVGSDHGTVVFLTAPARCGGAGYASSERGALTAPNIQVFYGYDVVDEADKQSPAPCEEIGRETLLGAERPLCLERTGDIVEVRVETPYAAEGVGADIKAEAAFTLVTDAGRLDRDLATFRTLVRRTSTCQRPDNPASPNGRPLCSAEGVWF